MTRSGSHRRGRVDRALLGCLALAIISSQIACVQRRLTIRSNPPGALVFIDDYEIGTTPVSTPFTYYGTRKIRLAKDGYETVVAYEHFWPPWYEIFPLDFVSENLVPLEIRDERAVEFQLAPQRIVPREELLGRADELRMATQMQGAIVQPPAGPASGVPAFNPEPIAPPAAVPLQRPTPVFPPAGSPQPGFSPIVPPPGGSSAINPAAAPARFRSSVQRPASGPLGMYAPPSSAHFGISR